MNDQQILFFLESEIASYIFRFFTVASYNYERWYGTNDGRDQPRHGLVLEYYDPSAFSKFRELENSLVHLVNMVRCMGIFRVGFEVTGLVFG
jgi:hypothetical protein